MFFFFFFGKPKTTWAIISVISTRVARSISLAHVVRTLTMFAAACHLLFEKAKTTSSRRRLGGSPISFVPKSQRREMVHLLFNESLVSFGPDHKL